MALKDILTKKQKKFPNNKNCIGIGNISHFLQKVLRNLHEFKIFKTELHSKIEMRVLTWKDIFYFFTF